MSQISLVGLPGVGKSTVGKHLARHLKRQFFDSDAEIEREIGCPIREFFEREGEERFRDIEQRIIAGLAALPGTVLATGGGAVLADENRRLLREHGWVVYLETSVAQQAERAGRTRHRPLLHGTDPEKRLAELMTVREPLYREVAHFTITTTRKRVNQVSERLVEAWRAANPPPPGS